MYNPYDDGYGEWSKEEVNNNHNNAERKKRRN